MGTIRHTDWVLLLLLAVAILWDVIAVVRWGPTGTISHSIREWSKRHPVVAFALGVLAGHWFW